MTETMKSWPVYNNIPVKDIEVGERLRPLDPKEVDRKVESIREVGLLQPITVSQHPTKKRGGVKPVYVLQAGLHRLEACKVLGMETIQANVTTLEGVRAELVEVDENLCRAELDLAQRKKFTAKRKMLYEILHPEAKKGNAQGEGMRRSAAGPDSENRSEVDDKEKPKSFVQDQHERTGLSPSTISLDVEHGSKIAPDVLDSIANTPLSNGKFFDELKVLTHDAQRKLVKARLAELEEEEKRKASQPKQPKQAKQPSKGEMLQDWHPRDLKAGERGITAEDISEAWLRALEKAWKPVRVLWAEEFPDAVRKKFLLKLELDLRRDGMSEKICRMRDERDAKFTEAVERRLADRAAGKELADRAAPDGAEKEAA